MTNIYEKASDEKRLQEIEAKLKELTSKKIKLEQQWKAEKKIIDEINTASEKLDELNRQAQTLEKEGDLAKVAEIRYGDIPRLRKDQEENKEKLKEIQGEKNLLRDYVTGDDIAELISTRTGIPVSKMLESEKKKLVDMEERLHQRVTGQEPAVRAVSNAIRRSRAGLQDENRPTGSFIFLGTTGVGKTEMARALAEFLFDDERSIVRFDMSEYSEKHTVSRLIGAPPGYVGYDQGGQLTEVIRNNPYSVVLLDEIEKAHPEIFNVLLQVLDDGRLTDGKGRTVNFKNTLIIMTSNLGSRFVGEAIDEGKNLEDGDVFDSIENQIRNLLKKSVKPEFLNRIDEIIIFRPLSDKDILKIVDLQLERLVRKLAKQNINIVVSESGKKLLAEMGYDIQNGARPLKRIIQNKIIDELSIGILNEDYDEGDTIYVEAGKNRDFVFSKNKITKTT